MKRWLAAIAIFIGSLLVLLFGMAYIASRQLSDTHATGIAFVRVFSLYTLAASILLAVFAVWLSGKLMR
jgi:putative copper export protein